MAALEKIRKKAVVLTIVIGLGLLAFIVEDGVRAVESLFNDNTAAKVGGDKIDIMEFQKREQELAAQNQNQNNQEDQAVRQQQLLDEMVFEKLLEQEYDKVGIDVTDSELSNALTGKNPSQAAMQFARQIGAETPAQAYDFIFNPAKYGIQDAQVAELRASWVKMQDDVLKQLKMQKLSMLVAGAIQANDLDRKQMADDGETTCYINFVKKDYSTLADNKFPVSDAEIKAEYNKEKNLFTKDEETRTIHYIAVNIDPSQNDIAKANAIVDKAYNNLVAYNGIDSIRTMSELRTDSVKASLSQITDNAVKEFVKGASVGSVYKADPQDRNYHLVKVLKIESSLDSVNVASVAVQGNKKLQDSVLNMLNSGKTLADVAKVKGVKTQDAEWQQIANAPDSLKNKIAAAGANFVALQSSAEGAYFCKVVEKKAPKTFYTLADVSFQSYASQKTIDDITNKLQNFLNKNNTIAAFEKNAAKAGYQAIEAEITPSTPQIGYNPQFGGGIKDSRKAIKWAFDSKPGDVSTIFSDNKDVLIVVALDNVYKGDYYPADYPAVKDYLTAKVRNSKKGDELMKQFAGKAKDLNSYAKLFGAAVDTTQVIFAQDGINKIDNSEMGLIGRMAVAKPGQLQGPWKGNSAIYVYQATKQERSKRVPSNDELNMQFARTRGGYVVANAQVMYRILSKAAGVKKNIIKFY